jgi:hypothetical protein
MSVGRKATKTQAEEGKKNYEPWSYTGHGLCYF